MFMPEKDNARIVLDPNQMFPHLNQPNSPVQFKLYMHIML